ncbi:MAG: tetratricopeptide repeat protein [Gammaproteobacteria bacterium]|nr:tetratricopeptide repeat protein [Gammaproteobacteria bacterium]MDH3464363.1 tetratricopeptide repeat protein [Gammaproteobacteria bacterium]
MSTESIDSGKNQTISNVSSLIRDGLKWLEVNRPGDAEQCFRNARLIQDDHPDACHLLAVALLRQNRDSDQAIELIQQALKAYPDQPIFLNSLGAAYSQIGQISEANDVFQRVVSVKDDYVEAHYNLGNTFRDLHRYEEAASEYQRVLDLDPGYVNAYNDIGLLHLGSQRYHEAIQQFKIALELEPARFDFHANLANALQSLGELESALIAIHNALALSPNDAKLHNNLGSIYHQQGETAEAIAAFRRSLELEARSLWPLYNLGFLLHQQGDHEQALPLFERAIAIDPDWAASWVNMASILYMLHRYDEAIDGYRTAIRLHPQMIQAWMNLATTYRRIGDLDNAISCFERSLALQPDHAMSHLGKAIVLLKAGRLEKGWRHYEWRFEVHGRLNIGPQDLARPEWSGAAFHGKTLLILGEQGMGDVIHFIRYAPMVKQLGGRIVLACAPALMRLLRTVPEIDEFVDRSEPLRVDFDYHVSLLSLPRIFNTTLATIPTEVPYLRADDSNIVNWQNRIDREQVNVGLVWSGNPDQQENVHRSCPLSAMAPLGRIAGVTYYSLQKGAGAEQLLLPPEGLKIVDFTGDLNDLSDTAALMSALDLTITVDTVTAHLAGALRRPVWTILWFAHCWRYLRERDDSPWYPSMRLFRQPRIGDWDSVIAQVCKALEEHLGR